MLHATLGFEAYSDVGCVEFIAATKRRSDTPPYCNSRLRREPRRLQNLSIQLRNFGVLERVIDSAGSLAPPIARVI
jgi:hypothetical protein